MSEDHTDGSSIRVDWDETGVETRVDLDEVGVLSFGRDCVSEDWAGDEEATSATSQDTLDGTETAMALSVEPVDNVKSLEPTCTLVDA